MAPRKKYNSAASKSREIPSTSRKLGDPSDAPLKDSVSTGRRRSTRQRLSEGTATFEERQQFVRMLELASQTEQKTAEDQGSKCSRENVQKYLHSLATVIANRYDKLTDIRFWEVKDVELLRMIAVITDESTELIHEKMCYYWSQKPSELKANVKRFLQIKRLKNNEKLKPMLEDEPQSYVSTTPSGGTPSKDLPLFHPASHSWTSDRGSSNDGSTDEDEFSETLKVSASRKSRKLSSSTEDSHDEQHEMSTEAEKKYPSNTAADNPELRVDYSSEQPSHLESEFIQQQQQTEKTSDVATSVCSPEGPKQAMYSAAVLTQPLAAQMQNRGHRAQARGQIFHSHDNAPKTSSTNSSIAEVHTQEASPSSSSPTYNNTLDTNVSRAALDFASSMLLLPDLQDRASLLQQLEELYYMSSEPQVQDKVVNIQAQLRAQQQYERTVLQLRLEELYYMPKSPRVQQAIADIQGKLQAPLLHKSNARCNAVNDSDPGVPMSIDLISGNVLTVESETSSGLTSEQCKQPENQEAPVDTSELIVEKKQLNAASKRHTKTRNSNNEDIRQPEIVDISSSDDECCVVFQSLSKQSSQTANGNSVAKKLKIE